MGLAQIVAAVFPGTSRSAASIFAGILSGQNRAAATEFAFLVGIPTMFAATGKNFYDQIQTHGAVSIDWFNFGIGFVSATITAFIAIKWLLRYIQNHPFTVFAWYRIAFGTGLLLWVYVGA